MFIKSSKFGGFHKSKMMKPFGAMAMNRKWQLLLLLALAFCRALPGADVSFYGIAKEQQFMQATGSSPVLAVSNAFRFTAFVVASTHRARTYPIVRPPRA